MAAGCSAAVRRSIRQAATGAALQAGGHRFDPGTLHRSNKRKWPISGAFVQFGQTSRIRRQPVGAVLKLAFTGAHWPGIASPPEGRRSAAPLVARSADQPVVDDQMSVLPNVPGSPRGATAPAARVPLPRAMLPGRPGRDRRRSRSVRPSRRRHRTSDAAAYT